MKSADQYCLDLLKQGDRERYLSVLFAPKEKRGSLAALYAFNLEIARIRETVHEPMIGEIRLHWWRDAIAGGRADSNDQNPVLDSLLDTIERYKLPKNAFMRYCDARVFDLYNDTMPDLNAFEGYCGDTACTLLQLSCLILDEENAAKAADASGHGGIAQAICGLLRLLPYTEARKQLYFPTSVIEAIGNTPSAFQSNLASDDEKQRLITAFVALGREHYQKFLVANNQLPKNIRLAFLPLSIIPSAMKKIEKAGIDAFKSSINVSPIYQFFTMFKTAISGRYPDIL